jgi:uncharacterized low-complexity protein
MLPGIRFIFVTIILSVSVLIFGLGAAALLRTAHEEFASLPAWRAAPPQLPAAPAETNMPTLAMLRIETLDVTRDAPEPGPSVSGTMLNTESMANDLNAAAETPPQLAPSVPSPEVATVSIQTNPQTEAEAPAPDMTAAEPSPDVKNRDSGTRVAALSDSKESEATTAEIETKQTEATEAKTAETKSGEAEIAEIKAVEVKALEPKTPEPKIVNSQTVVLKTVVVKIQAKIIKPSRPVIKKAKRSGIYAVAQRRRAAARARAIARARAAWIAAQQRLVQPDPLAALFGIPAQPAQIAHTQQQ